MLPCELTVMFDLSQFGAAPPPKPLISEGWRMALRITGFVASIFVISAYGSELELINPQAML